MHTVIIPFTLSAQQPSNPAVKIPDLNLASEKGLGQWGARVA